MHGIDEALAQLEGIPDVSEVLRRLAVVARVRGVLRLQLRASKEAERTRSYARGEPDEREC